MLIDIHTHTYPTSDDSNLTPQDLISEAKKVGLDGICITDHDGFWNPRDIEKIGIKSKTSNSVQEAVKYIFKKDKQSIIVILGSIYLIGEVLNLN